MSNIPDTATSFLEYLQKSYRSIGAFEPDFVYIYSDFRYFARYMEELGGREDFCRVIVEPFIKNGQTVIMTTFTYTRQGRFDVLAAPAKLGALNKWILKQPGVLRSEHPLFSYAALGPRSDLVLNIGKSAFGCDSIFNRLKNKNAAFLHIGRPISMGNTIIHHIEQYCGATYRVHKAFKTEVFRGDKYIGTDYTAFVRRSDVEGENFYFNFTEAANALKNSGIIRSTDNNDSFFTISNYDYDAAFLFLRDLFYKDQALFIKGDFIQY